MSGTDQNVPETPGGEGGAASGGDGARSGPVPPPTTHELSGSGTGQPTTHEDRRGTTREDVRAAAPPSSGWNPFSGLAEIDDRYEHLGFLASGGEASLYRARRRDGSEPDEVVVKIYNRGVELSDDALGRIAGIASSGDDAHVVRLIDWGNTAVTGQWFEVLELIENGSLSDLASERGPMATDDPLLMTIIEQLHDALKAMHAAGVSHHDLKPSNVLVRRRPPALDLVLTDFGVAAAVQSAAYVSRRDGTVAYFSPEALAAGQGGPARDYWALGMTIAEVAGGVHPLAKSLGGEQALDTPSILAFLHDRNEIDVRAVGDERVQHLCRGLLRYSATKRWGSAEVDAWLAGEDPPVHSDAVRSVEAGFRFVNATYTSGPELARAFAADWRAAVGRLGQPGTPARRMFFDDLTGTFGGEGIASVEERLASTNVPLDRSLAELLVALDPEDPPIVFRGKAVDAPGLARLATAALAGEEDAARVVKGLLEQEALEAYAQTPRGAALAALDHRWRQEVSRFDALIAAARDRWPGALVSGSALRAGSAEVPQYAILAALADDGFAADLAARRTQAIRAAEGCLRESWFASEIGSGSASPAEMLAAIRLAGSAADVVAERHQLEVERAQARMRATVEPVGNWLVVTGLFNLLAGIVVLGLAVARQVYADEIAADPAAAEEIAQWEVFLWSAPLFLLTGVAAFYFRRRAATSIDVGWVRGAQVVAVLTTITIPLIIPLGLAMAFLARWQRCSPDPSRLRMWGGLGALVGLVVVGLVWWDADASAFDWVFGTWPRGLQEWWVDTWPPLLDPGLIAENAPNLQFIVAGLTVAALGGVWWSYADERPVAHAAPAIGLVGLGIGAALALPYIGTAVAVASYVAIIIGVIAVALGVVFAVWAACSD